MCMVSSMEKILITGEVLHFGVRGTLKISVPELWDNAKHPNIQIIGIPEEEDQKKKKRNDKILAEIIVENFTKMG